MPERNKRDHNCGCGFIRAYISFFLAVAVATFRFLPLAHHKQDLRLSYDPTLPECSCEAMDPRQ